MLYESAHTGLNSSTKRARTHSTPTSDQGNTSPRFFPVDIAMTSNALNNAVNRRSRPNAGTQLYEIQQSMTDRDVAPASGVPHYLVPYSWWYAFMKHVKEMGDEPPELDLTQMDALKEGGELRSDLKNGRDIQILQANTWSKIQEWYGVEDEQFVRHSYKRGPDDYVVELRPTDLYFSYFTPPNQFSPVKCIAMYKYKDVDGLYEKVRYAFGISDTDQIRFWHTTESEGLTNLDTAKEAITKTHERVSIGHVIGGSTSFIVETRKNGTEKWPLESTKTTQVVRYRPVGTKGLINLGNTCYMASALQCLCHVKEFAEYFKSGYYKTELNSDNPLGYGGKVAKAFAGLLEQLYAQDVVKSIAPRELKTVLGNINSSFGGYQQQDSQELLAFLLDALHEDLNRIIKKPATERPDIGQVSATELLRLGTEAWKIHKLRNDSVVVDLFQGIYKSTLVCPICAHVSVTFDPFSDLSLPLPFRSYWTHDIFFVPLQGPIRKINLEFEQNASIGHLVAYFAKRYSLPASSIAGAEVWKHRFYKFYENYMPITTIEKDDVAYFYELIAADPRVDKASTNILLPVYTFRSADKDSKPEECALPLVVMITEEEATDYNAIKGKLLATYSKYTTSKDLTLTHKDVHPEQSYDSDSDDLLTARKPVAKDQSIPFEIKVASAKVTSFYDRAASVPLLQRMPNAQIKQDPDPDPPVAEIGPEIMDFNDDLPPYDSLKHDVFPDPDINNTEHEMKDDSDDEVTLIEPRQTNLDLVSKYLEQQPADSLRTPESTPVSPATTDPSASASAPKVSLLSNGDALQCEWSYLSYKQIFSEEADTLAGKSCWDDYEVDVDQVMTANRETRESSKDNVKSLEDCLDEFAKEEPLDAENTWYCPKCKEHQRANKTFELWRTGDILVFHLKRFSSSRSLSDKIDAEIQFPIRGLDMSNRLGERKLRQLNGEVVEDSVYDLTGVVNHYGGLGGGHYTAFAQTFDEDGYKDFYNFNGIFGSPHALIARCLCQPNGNE